MTRSIMILKKCRVERSRRRELVLTTLIIILAYPIYAMPEQTKETVHNERISTTTQTKNLQVSLDDRIHSTTTGTTKMKVENAPSNTEKQVEEALEVTQTLTPTEDSGENNGSETDTCDVRWRSEPESPKFVLLYILVFIYSFLCITVTCHQYFVTSLSRICDNFKFSEEIFGATFLAIGSSAPELATVIISVFSTKNDIGISEVIGSAIFNVIFVIALCGLATKTALKLSWWPLLRNCFFYSFSILLMLIAIRNEQVSWLSSSVLIAAYGLYLIALYYNEFLEAWANTLPLPFKDLQNRDDKDLDTNYIPLEERVIPSYTATATSERNSIVQSNGRIINSIQETYQSNVTGENENGGENSASSNTTGVLGQIKFYFLNPVYYVCKMTIPDWQGDRFHNLYFLTFFVSFFWIAVYSFIMIRMIVLIGNILTIPNTVMGLTLIAAGNSVPDAVTSLKVVGQGCGDMAVSNVIGSNIFDILICLGVPWFLQTAVIRSETYVEVCSKGMVYTTMMLLLTVVLLICAIHKNDWKLDRKIGTVLMVGYFVFILTAVGWEILTGNQR